MFDKERIGMRFSKIEHRVMVKDEKEIGLVEVTLEINPFTVELAKDLDEFVRRTLYTMNDSEVSGKLKGAAFQLPIRSQEIVVRMAPDQSKASYTIQEAKIGTLHAQRSKKSSAWRLVFTITVAPASEHQLAQIVEDYTKTRYLTFANAEATLFDEDDKAARKGRSAPVAAGESAATH